METVVILLIFDVAAWRWDFDSRDGLNSTMDKEKRADVQLAPTGYNLPKLALPATIGWYLHKQQEEEAASVAAIVPIMG